MHTSHSGCESGSGSSCRSSGSWKAADRSPHPRLTPSSPYTFPSPASLSLPLLFPFLLQLRRNAADADAYAARLLAEQKVTFESTTAELKASITAQERKYGDLELVFEEFKASVGEEDQKDRERESIMTNRVNLLESFEWHRFRTEAAKLVRVVLFPCRFFRAAFSVALLMVQAAFAGCSVVVSINTCLIYLPCFSSVTSACRPAARLRLRHQAGLGRPQGRCHQGRLRCRRGRVCQR